MCCGGTGEVKLSAPAYVFLLKTVWQVRVKLVFNFFKQSKEVALVLYALRSY